ncbi:MAG: glycosyltransferase family 39 protein [Desulfobacterales bacterium]|nr:glycosyltransferase family 39 protein [Desulfobacterales bacterium]
MNPRSHNQVLPPWFSAKTTLMVVGLLALFVLTQWNTLTGPFERDEGEYAYAAWLMSEGMVPYRDSFMQKPPMIIYTYWLSQLLSDQAYWPPRLLGSISVALTAILIGLIVRKEYGHEGAWISMWIFLPMWCLPHILPFAANTEKFMNLPMVATLAIYTFFRHENSRWAWLAAGAGASLALLYKPICLLVISFVLGLWFYDSWKSGAGLASTAKNAILAMCGTLVAALITLSFFLVHGAWGDLWESAFAFNRYYAQISWTPVHFLRIMETMARMWWVLLPLLLWFLIKREGRWRFHLALFLIALASAYKDPNGHYYIMILPFLAIISGAALGSAVHAARKKWLALGITFDIGIVCLVVAILCFPVRHQFRLPSSELYRWTYGAGNPFHESPVAAGRIAALTKPGDLVFVAGSEPQILYYAKRKSPTRFVIMYPLMLPSPFAERYQRETLHALQERPPEIILLSTSHYSWLAAPKSPQLLIPFLNTLFQSGLYEPVGGYLWEKGHGRWEEPLSQKKADQCSLLLFKRRSPEIHS